MHLFLVEYISGKGRICKHAHCPPDALFAATQSRPPLCRVVIAQMLCLGLAFKWPNVRKTELSWHLPGSTGSYSRTLLALLSVSSVAVTIYRLPSSPPQPHSPGPRILTAGIWTVHFGIDNQGRDSQRRIRDLVR